MEYVLSIKRFQDDSAIRDEIVKLIQLEAMKGAALSSDENDLVQTGDLDSMGWVGILSGIEEATGIRNLGASWPEGRPQSIHSLVEAVRDALQNTELKGRWKEPGRPDGIVRPASVTGWGAVLGSMTVPSARIEEACGLPANTMVGRAGIGSVAHAAEDDNEIALGAKAAGFALEKAGVELETIDVLVGISTTSVGFPSFAALLHNRLLLPESCAAVDVGGACVGLIHGLATANAMLGNGPHRVALVVASEVNSRALAKPGVPAEFRALFGDGSCAFVLSRKDADNNQGMHLGDFISGCSGAFSSALSVGLRPNGDLEVVFKGEQLAGAAITALQRVIESLEALSGTPRSSVDFFALHEANPRLVEILVERLKIPPEKVPRTAHTSGNLGSVTCGVNLCSALTQCEASPGRTIFLAAVAPGLLWAGAHLTSPPKKTS